MASPVRSLEKENAVQHFEPGGRFGPRGGGRIPEGFPGGDHGAFHHDGWGVLGGVLWLVLLAAVIVLAVVVANKLVNRNRPAVAAAAPAPVAAPAAPSDDALTVLRARYARGEVGREEFLQASADLGAPAEPPTATG